MCIEQARRHPLSTVTALLAHRLAPGGSLSERKLNLPLRPPQIEDLLQDPALKAYIDHAFGGPERLRKARHFTRVRLLPSFLVRPPGTLRERTAALPR